MALWLPFLHTLTTHLLPESNRFMLVTSLINLRRNPTLLPLPAILEEAIRANTEYCDLMLYPLSPTHSLPATRGLMDADEEYLREVRKSTSCVIRIIMGSYGKYRYNS